MMKRGTNVSIRTISGKECNGTFFQATKNSIHIETTERYQIIELDFIESIIDLDEYRLLTELITF